jgi:hypothetical protein
MNPRVRLTVIVTAVLSACVVVVLVAAGMWASGLESAAESGKAQAEAGARSLAAQDATSAVTQFRSASESFARAQSMLGPDWVGGAAGTVPWAARQYATAKALVAIGLDASNAGVELASALQEASSTPVPAGSTRLGALLGAGRVHIDAALSLLAGAAERAAGLSEEGLDPRLAKAVRSLKDALREAAPYLGRIRPLLVLERYLLSAPRRILVISQNSAELRPTGGFAGTYGILNVGPQGFSLEKYRDVYTLPNPPGRVKPPPGAKMTRDFGFRDANWWIDFPTSAKAMLGFWTTYRQRPVDGILALDVVAVRDLLEVTGPVRVASFEETFTADNLLDRLLYLIEVKSRGTSDRKDVLVALAEEVERRLLDSGPTDLGRAAMVLARSADAKHVQFYFNDPDTQNAVGEVGWSGSIAPPEGTTDLLAVSNAMTKPGKVNIAMRKTIDYRVALQPDGSADTTLVLGYSNTASKRFAVSSSVFRDYLRVYRSQGTALATSPRRSPMVMKLTVDAGTPAIAGEFSLERGQRVDVTIGSNVPFAWRQGVAPIVPRRPTSSPTPAGLTDASHYRLFIVRQADLEDVPTVVSVSPPPGWRMVGSVAWRTASGEAVVVSVEGTSARLSAPLAGDMVLDVTMERE